MRSPHRSRRTPQQKLISVLQTAERRVRDAANAVNQLWDVVEEEDRNFGNELVADLEAIAEALVEFRKETEEKP